MSALGWLGWMAARRWGAAALVGTLGLAASGGLTAAVFLCGPVLDDQYSAKAIVQVLVANPATKDRPIVLPYGDTIYSAPFYLDAVFHGRFKPCRAGEKGLVQKLLDAHGGEVFVFHAEGWSKLQEKKPELAARLTPIARTDHWVACEEKHQP
jgi:hypothetical protein